MGPVLFAFVLAATAQTPADQLRESTEARVRADVQELLGKLCADRCLVLGVTARVEEVADEEDEPGFEKAKKTTHPMVRSVAVSIVASDALPAEFRAKLKPLVTARVKPLAPQVQVTLELVKLPPDEQTADAPPVDVPVQTAPAPEPWRWREALTKALVESAPLIAASLLFALAIVAAAAVLRPRKRERAVSPPTSPTETVTTAPITRRALPEDRGLRNRVVREAIAAREWELLAAWHAVYGEALFEDARGQLGREELSELKSALERSPSRVDDALRAFDARMTAARLATSADPAAACFDFLESIPGAAFVSALGSLSASDRSVALRFAPPHLRKAGFQILSAADRSVLILSWSTSPLVPVELARSVSTSLKTTLDQLGGAASPDDAMAELLAPLTRAEQDALIATLGPKGAQAALCTESSLARASIDALTAAVTRLPPVRLATYLAGAEATLKERVLGACPQSIREEVAHELRQQTGRTGDFHTARTELIRTLRSELQRRGEA